MIKDQSGRDGGIARPPAGLSALDALNALGREPGTDVRRLLARYPAGAMLLGAADPANARLLIASGWACEVGQSPTGRRQVFSFVLPGEVVDLARLSEGQRSLIALTRVEAVSLAALLPGDPVARAEMQERIEQALEEREDRLFDQALRLGRLNGKARVLNLLLEFQDRLRAAGLGRGDSFRLPVTQEVIADALGLSRVHLNRTLRQLRSEGTVVVGWGEVTIHRRPRLAEVACYSARLALPCLLPILTG